MCTHGKGCVCIFKSMHMHPGAEACYALRGPWPPPKFFKTSIIVGRNRSHTFSFKSWPPYEKNLPPSPIRSHKNAPPQIPTFPLFYFSFPSLRHVSHIPHFFYLSEAISHSYSKTLVWELSLESRETVRVKY